MGGDVLSQAEIDALVAAMLNGGKSEDSGGDSE